MKFANESRAVVFFIYECEDRHLNQHKGVLLEKCVFKKYGYFKVTNYLNSGEIVSVLYDDLNMFVFDTAKNKIMDFSENWRKFIERSHGGYKAYIETHEPKGETVLIKRALKDGILSTTSYEKIISHEKNK